MDNPTRETHPELFEELDDHLDRLIDVRNSVKPGERILLVGPNGSGKSLLRKQMPGHPELRDKQLKMVHASMALRTGNFAHMGALASMFNDFDDDATSVASVKLVSGAIRNCARWVEEGGLCGLHIDEPEVGCSEETQLGMAGWMRKQLDELPEGLFVTMLTTHSRHVAAEFADWRFVDLSFEHTTLESWLNREMKPIDPEELSFRSLALFRAVLNRTKRK